MMTFTKDELYDFFIMWRSQAGVICESADCEGDSLSFKSDPEGYEVVAVAGEGIEFYLIDGNRRKPVDGLHIGYEYRWVLSDNDCSDMSEYVRKSKEVILMKTKILNKFENFLSVHNK